MPEKSERAWLAVIGEAVAVGERGKEPMRIASTFQVDASFVRIGCIASLCFGVLAACSGGETDSEATEEPAAAVTETVDDAVAPVETATASAPDNESEPEQIAAAAPAPSTPVSAPATPAAPAPKAAAAAPPVADAKPPASFAQCAVCHTVNEGGANRLGPNLWAVAGAKAAQGAFNFSPALKNSGLTWTDANLDKWLENPRELVPGNRMAFMGVRDAARRKEIIDYMKQLR